LSSSFKNARFNKEMKAIKTSGKELEKLINRNLLRKRRIERTVSQIIEDVRSYGDEALIKYTKKFDGVRLTARQLKVTESETSGAYQNISPDFISTLKLIIENVVRFYKKQLKKCWKIKDEDGMLLGEVYQPLERVGIYVPAGSAPLVSSVYMSVLPAKIAGVREITLVTPPDASGNVNPHILVVASLLKVDHIYKVGGAQAIAALAFGTRTIPKVDKIVGPGNAYVTEAKRQVFGFVGIDMVAGPTELVIIANQFSNLDYVIADLSAQMEHLGGLAILITTSKKFARQVKDRVKGGYIIVAKNSQEATELVNRIAPEHLEIMIKSPAKLVKKIKNAGAIFVGPYSPTAVGDYAAGPSHILPTGGTARFFSGLGIKDFIKSIHVISFSKRALEKAAGPVERLASIEGLTKHWESVRVRLH
jgi:histidinol dehydrogenase